MKKIICIVVVSFFTVSLFNDLYALDTVSQDNFVNESQIDDEDVEKNSSVDVLINKEKKASNTIVQPDVEISTNQEQPANNKDNLKNIQSESNSLSKIDDRYLDSPVVEPQLEYSTHVQDHGWMSYVTNGNLSGTEGKSKRLEGIKIKLTPGDIAGGISYSTHVQNIGWMDYCNNDDINGTVGKSLRLEAIKIKLTGDIANYYDIYYRVHIQDYGWLDWARNGFCAGSQNYSKRLEAIQIIIVKKGENAPGRTNIPFKTPGKVYYSGHIQDYGWSKFIGDGKTSGTIGKSKRLEAIKIGVSDLPYDGGIEYSAHIENLGWQNYRSNEGASGTVGRSLRIEAVKIRLTGELADYYDVYYRLHVQNYGWLDWTKNDEKAGTEGLSLRTEAIEIQLIDKNGKAPGSTTRPYIALGDIDYNTYIQNNGWTNSVSNGGTSGTIGRSLRIEAIKISLGKNEYNGNVEYTTHVQDYGWLNYVSNGMVSGKVGQSKRVEALKIKLTGDIANHYDVYYRVQCQDVGWLDWTYNDRIAGTIGGAYRVEAVQVRLYPKQANKPATSNRSSVTFLQKNGFKVCIDANGRLLEDAQSILGTRGAYVLRVNKQTNVVSVLIQDGEGVYSVAYKRFVCSVGNDTPFGTFYTPVKYRWKELMGPSYGQFSTRIVGGILFHSVPYNKMNNRTLSARMYNQLGTTCSHGCVRLTCGDAKWIYDNCPIGTRVDILWGNDPLSKPLAQKLPLSQTWDPTDPTL